MIYPEADINEPVIRVLICKECGSAEELPNFEGNPDNDFVLKSTLEPHRFPDGQPHKGRLYTGILQRIWAKPDQRQALVEHIWKSEGGAPTGLDPWVYPTVETLKEDAMSCWRGRQRPVRCADFHSDSKRLTPPTQEERKDAGVRKYQTKKLAAGQVRFLCDYCVCRMQVETEINEKRDV